MDSIRRATHNIGRAILLVAVLASLLMCIWLTGFMFKGTIIESRARGMIGQPIDEVVDVIGPPREIITQEQVEMGTAAFPPDGWTLDRERSVTPKVYLYLDVPRGDYVCLLVDARGILVDVVRVYS